MRFSRGTLVFLALVWALVALYPDPTVLVRSVRDLFSPPIQPDAVAALAARLPDDPASIERAVLRDVVPYASDWESAGVPWAFPSAVEVLRAGRGDCESRAVVLASVLAAKGIPYDLRMSFDHIWVDYPGKVPTAMENDGLALAQKGRGGWAGLHWPRDFDLRREAKAQAAIYWDPMPEWRKGLLFAGLLWIGLWNALANVAARPSSAWVRRGGVLALDGPPRPSSARGPS
jgi:hypothetical protein